jgi:hypothetical protein
VQAEELFQDEEQAEDHREAADQKVLPFLP